MWKFTVAGEKSGQGSPAVSEDSLLGRVAAAGKERKLSEKHTYRVPAHVAETPSLAVGRLRN